mmetsp:Transcript_78300/g.122169  ORF Transcript_78300/g.122169 Transcript_78300/m.122169 type:complete len:527 (+) Transcript_78300:356-1936(+)
MDAIAAQAIAKLPQFIAQEISNTAWAFATLAVSNDPLFEAIAAESIRRIREYDPQALSNTAWSFATLGVMNAPLMQAISAESLPKIRHFLSQNLGNTVWALAKLAIQDYHLLHSIASASIPRMSSYRPQELSNTAWALAKLGFRHAPLMDSLASEAINLMSDLNPHDLSGTAWAFATLSYADHKPLLNAISAAARSRLAEFNSQDLANTAWSFATICVKDSEILDSQCAEALAKLSEFAPQGLATTAWAYSSLKKRDSALMDAISGEVLKRIDEIEPQSLGILADAKLDCGEAVEKALRPYVARFLEALPKTLDQHQFDTFSNFLHSLHIDNFGAQGTKQIFLHMQFPAPSAEFCDRAMQEIQNGVAAYSGDTRRSSAAVDALSGAALVHRRVFSYAEYDILVFRKGMASHGGVKLVGSMMKENGLREQDRSTERGVCALRAVASPISGLVNRHLCSEFQLLKSLVDIFYQESGSTFDCQVTGHVRLFVSTAPCVSCLGALRQFTLMFPQASMEVANGEEAYLLCS